MYGLYKSIDAAAFAWGRVFAKIGNKDSEEYAAEIYQVLIGNEIYYGFTRAVKFNGEASKSHSPGPYNKFHVLPKGMTNENVVGVIHTHYVGSDGVNVNFSEKDKGNWTDYSHLTHYLINNNGDLRVHRPKGGNEDEKQPIIGLNFYRYLSVTYTENINGVRYTYDGQIPVPVHKHAVPGFAYTRSFPVYYIDPSSGTIFDLNKNQLKWKLFNLILITFYSSILLSCKQKIRCNLEIGPVNDHVEALKLLKSNKYQFSDSFKISSPKFIKQMYFYSCNKKIGFLLYKSIYNGEYFLNKVTHEDWLRCKVATNCDSLMENYLSKKYLSYQRKEVFINGTIK